VVLESIFMQMEANMRVIGWKISNMAWVKKLGKMAALTLGIMWIPKRKEKVSIHGLMEIHTWANGETTKLTE
jgi:hypothetical protein